MKGALDRVTPRRAIGWAAYSDHHAPVRVTISVNGEPAAEVDADRPRPDIRKAGLHPSGRCGFALEFPQDLRLSPGDLVSARIIGSDRDLDGSPMRCVPRAERLRGPAAPTPTEGVAGVAAARSSLPSPGQASSVPPPPRIPPVMGRSSLRICFDSLRAFMMRELRNRYGSGLKGYIMAIVQPIIFMLLLRTARHVFSGGTSASDEVHGVSSMYYFMLGILPYMMFQNGFHRAMGAIRQFKSLFNYPQVQPVDAVIVRIVIEYLMMAAVFIVMLAGYWIFGFEIEFDKPVEFLAIIAQMFLFSVGLGLFLDVWVTKRPELKPVFAMIERPLFFVSGVFFSVEDLPDEIKVYLMWNPLLHAVDLARDQMLSQYESECSWLYLFIWTISVLLLGLAQYRRHLLQLREGEGDEA